MLLLSCVFILNNINYSIAEMPDVIVEKADGLKALGIFKGSSKGFELDRIPTRAEAAILFVRLIGKDSAINSVKHSHPFTDVPESISSYVGYLYENNYISGIADNKFGTNSPASAESFITYLLLALGYTNDVDFTLSSAIQKAASIGLINDEQINALKNEAFTREDIVVLVYKALTTRLKNNTEKLIDKLIHEKVISREIAVKLGLKADHEWYYDKLVYKESEYYIDYSGDFCLNKITDGVKNKLTRFPVYSFDIINDSIFYTNGVKQVQDNGQATLSGGYDIYKMDLNGSSIRQVVETGSKQISQIQAYNDHVYYNYDQRINFFKWDEIFRVDNGEKIKNVWKKYLHNMKSFIIHSGDFYYISGYSINKATYNPVKEDTLLVKEDSLIETIGITDGWIYYTLILCDEEIIGNTIFSTPRSVVYKKARLDGSDCQTISYEEYKNSGVRYEYSLQAEIFVR